MWIVACVAIQRHYYRPLEVQSTKLTKCSLTELICINTSGTVSEWIFFKRHLCVLIKLSRTTALYSHILGGYMLCLPELNLGLDTELEPTI